MSPDDAVDRPLTPGERAVIADIERRLLLDEPELWEPGTVRSTRVRPAAPRVAPPRTAAVPLVALLCVACLLVAVLAATEGGLLGTAAVLGSVVVTAVVWPLLPAALGGPVRPRRPPYRTSGRPPGR